MTIPALAAEGGEIGVKPGSDMKPGIRVKPGRILWVRGGLPMRDPVFQQFAGILDLGKVPK
jgi:hypothetical protein